MAPFLSSRFENTAVTICTNTMTDTPDKYLSRKFLPRVSGIMGEKRSGGTREGLKGRWANLTSINTAGPEKPFVVYTGAREHFKLAEEPRILLMR